MPCVQVPGEDVTDLCEHYPDLLRCAGQRTRHRACVCETPTL